MTKSNIFVAICIFSNCLSVSAQEPVVQKYGNMISVSDLKEYLSILASDAMEGRETGKRGQKMAAAFIRAHYEDLGLAGPVAGGYYQPIDLYTTVPGETYVTAGTVRMDNFTDIVYYGSDNSGGEISAPLVFIGNASQADLDQVDIKDKAVLLFSSSEWLAGNSAVALARQKGAKMVLVCNTESKKAYDLLVSQIKTINNSNGLSLSRPLLSD